MERSETLLSAFASRTNGAFNTILDIFIIMYTIWLMPDENAYQKLNRLILNLSNEHQTPVFDPHVTLLSGISNTKREAIALARQFAQRLSPLKVSLTRIEYLEFYYRCLFFRTDESQPLFEARETAEELFRHSNIRPFIPHISFLYGALPIFKKQAIINALGDRFFMNFELSELRLVKTDYTPESWKILFTILLR